MDIFRNTVEEFQEKAKQKSNEFDQEMRRRHALEHETENKFNRILLPKLLKARASDYSNWLRGYIENGGEPSHSYDYQTPGDFYVAIENFDILPLYGAQSISIIIPKGITFLGGELGHCNLYFVEGFRHLGSFVPVYEDTI